MFKPSTFTTFQRRVSLGGKSIAGQQSLIGIKPKVVTVQKQIGSYKSAKLLVPLGIMSPPPEREVKELMSGGLANGIQKLPQARSGNFGNQMAKLRAIASQKSLTGGMIAGNVPTEVDLMELVIHFKSTWGDSDVISCSSVGVMNNEKRRIPINEKKVWPETKESNVELLFDQKVLKHEGEDIWCVPFDPEYGVKIKMKIEATQVPTSILIWNGAGRRNDSVKNFEIFIDGCFAGSSIVDQNFGVNYPIDIVEARVACAKRNEILVDHDPKRETYLSDQYGEIPMKRAHRITIELLDNWSKTNNQVFGLNAIEFLDCHEQVIDTDCIGTSCHDMQVGSSLRTLFDANMDRTDANNMFVGDIAGPHPSISFDLPGEAFIRTIIVYNYNKWGDDCDIGVKKMKVMVDGVSVWVGTIKKGIGRQKDIQKYATHIKLIDGHVSDIALFS